MANIQFNLIKKGISFIGFFLTGNVSSKHKIMLHYVVGTIAQNHNPTLFTISPCIFFPRRRGGGEGGMGLTQIEGIWSNT